MHRLFFLLLMAGSLVSQAAPHSAWPMPKRKFLLVPGLYFYQASRYWTADHTVLPFGESGRFHSLNLRLYAEYGLSDRLTLVGVLPFTNNRYDSRTLDNRNQGLTDLELGVRYNLLNRDNRRYLSLQAVGIAPLYVNESRTPYLGYASSGAEIRLLYAGSFKLAGRNAYFNTEAGLRHFFTVSERSVSQIPMLATLGWYVSEKNVLTAELAGQLSYSNRFRALNPVNPTVNTDFRFVKTTLGYGRQISPGAWVYASVFADIYGRNVGVGRGFSLTSVIRF